MKYKIGFLLLLIFVLTGCGLLSEDPLEEEHVKGVTLPPGGNCNDLNPQQQAFGDSLVALATETGIIAIEEMVRELDNGEWAPRMGMRPSKCRINSGQIPVSRGVHGPGEMIRCVGLRASASSTVILSLRTTKRSTVGSNSPMR